MTRVRILVVEDEPKLAALLQRGLRGKGHAVDLVADGAEAVARRETVPRPPVLEVGDLHLDPATRHVWRGTERIELSPTEFRVLEVFMRRPGIVLSRDELLERAWDRAYDPRSNVVDVHVGH